jgi:hypothetical protein
MIEEAKVSNNFTPLIRKIGSVFSNPDAIKNCFLSTPLEGDSIVIPGQIFYNLDIAAVRAAYKLILDLDKTDVNNALISANGRLASQLKHVAHTINKPEDLRQLIILLENPQLVDPETHREILGPVLACIVTLPSAQTNVSYVQICYTRRVNPLFMRYFQIYNFDGSPAHRSILTGPKKKKKKKPYTNLLCPKLPITLLVAQRSSFELH